MNIVLIAQNLKGRDGWSRYALELGKALASRGHHITAVVQETSGQRWCEEVALLAGPISYLKNPLLCFFSAWRLRRYLAKKNPEIVHIMVEPYALLLPFLKMRKMKTCLTIHGSYAVVPLAMGGITGFLMRRAYTQVHRVLSVSRFTKYYLQRENPDLFQSAGLEEKIHVLTNAVCLPADLPQKLPATQTPKRIISVGAIKSRKGYLQLVDACAVFQKLSSVPFTVDLFGSCTEDPVYTKKLQEKIQTLQLQNIIRLRGSVSDAELKEAYMQADLFLLLSLHQGQYVEGFGLVLLEANAYGVPVIGPNTGGCSEAVDEGRSGYICDPEDPATIAKRMQDILIHGTIASGSCRAWAQEHSIQQAAEKLEQEYKAR